MKVLERGGDKNNILMWFVISGKLRQKKVPLEVQAGL